VQIGFAGRRDNKESKYLGIFRSATGNIKEKHKEKGDALKNEESTLVMRSTNKQTNKQKKGEKYIPYRIKLILQTTIHKSAMGKIYGSKKKKKKNKLKVSSIPKI